MQAPKTDTPATQTRIELDDLLCPLRNIDEVETQTILSKEANRRINLAFSLGRQELESTLAAERASRVQAEDQAFNAGIVEAAKAARDWNPEKHGDSVDAIMAKAKPCTPETHIWRSGECTVCDVSKPSVSPEQAEENK